MPVANPAYVPGADQEVHPTTVNVIAKDTIFSAKDENSNGKNGPPKESDLHERYLTFFSRTISTNHTANGMFHVYFLQRK